MHEGVVFLTMHPTFIRKSMADIRPFRGLYFNPSTIPLQEVIAPPYDKIPSSLHQELLDQTPLNAVRFTRVKEGDSYADSAALLEIFQREGALQRDENPCLYVVAQSFKDPLGLMKHRTGVLAACKLEEFRGGGVIPHLRTLSRPREDRFRHIQATNANVSPVVGMYHDPTGSIQRLLERASTGLPFVEFTKGKVITRLWRIDSPELTGSLRAAFSDLPLMIADGHHLYEAALTYRDMMRLKTRGNVETEPWNFVMTFLSSIDESGHTILPVHRLANVTRGWDWDVFTLELSKNFRVKTLENADQMHLAFAKRTSHTIGIVSKKGMLLAGLKDDVPVTALVGKDLPVEVRDADVTLLHAYVLEKLLGLDWHAQQIPEFVRHAYDIDEAVLAVRSGEADLAFILNPLRMEQVMQVFRSQLTLPAKSTYFFPYFPTGLVMRRLDEQMR